MTALLIRHVGQQHVPPERCEEIVQEAWVHAFAHKEKFRGERNLGRLFSWLAQIVRNVGEDERRWLNRHSTQSLDALALELLDVREMKRAAAAELREQLSEFLARLRNEEPENYWLLCEHRLEGRGVQELALETGWSANEISCRIYRVMQKLRSWAAELRPHGERQT